MKDFKDSLVSGFAWQASTKLFVQIFSWISTIWVARLLVPEDYGLVAMSGIVTGVFLLLATSGLAAGVVNRKEITKGELDTVFWLSVSMGAGLYTIVYFVADPAAEYFEDERLNDVVKVAGLMVLFSSFKLVPYAIALRNLNYKMISVTEMVGAFIGIAVTLILAIYGFQYWSLVIGTISAEIFMTCTFFVHYKYAPKFSCNIGLVKDLLCFGGTLLVSRALSYVSSNIPVFFLSTYTNAKVTGHFQMAQTFANLPSSKVGILFNNLIFPAMSRIKDDRELTKSTFLQMHTSLLFVTAPMFFGLALVAEPLIHVVLTEPWYPIIGPFQTICAIAVIRLSSQFITRAIEGLGDPSVSLWHQIYSIAIYGPSLWFAVLEWGLEGMLLTWLLTAPILYLYLLSRITSVLKLRLVEILNMYVPIGICILIMSTTVVFVIEFTILEKSDLMQLIVSVLVGATTFAFAATIFARAYVKKLKSIILSTFLRRKR